MGANQAAIACRYITIKGIACPELACKGEVEWERYLLGAGATLAVGRFINCTRDTLGGSTFVHILGSVVAMQ